MMDCCGIQLPSKPPLHTSYSCKISQQHPLHVHTLLEAKKNEIFFIFWVNGPLKGTNIFLNEDVSLATQSIRNAKMGELQAARQRGLIAYFSGTKLVT